MLTTPAVKAERRRRAADRSRKRRWDNGDRRCPRCAGAKRYRGEICARCDGSGRMPHPGLNTGGTA